MTALLGLLAVAGYQNRDKLAELLGGAAPDASGAPGPGQRTGQEAGQGAGLGRSQPPASLGGLLGNLQGGGLGGLLGGGLGELVESFRRSGQGEVADSWVGTGPNRPVGPPQLEQAIGPDVLATLAQQTGLSREEILARLARELPEAVDKYTPHGRLPGADDFSRS
jgi:uncharacterized protein YidB (DUF937 family)